MAKRERKPSPYKYHNLRITPDPGTLFDTPFESGCRFVSDIADDGSFNAFDSDGVLCSFHVDMIERIY
jgi:hypothetical protein